MYSRRSRSRRRSENHRGHVDIRRSAQVGHNFLSDLDQFIDNDHVSETATSTEEWVQIKNESDCSTSDGSEKLAEKKEAITPLNSNNGGLLKLVETDQVYSNDAETVEEGKICVREDTKTVEEGTICVNKDTKTVEEEKILVREITLRDPFSQLKDNIRILETTGRISFYFAVRKFLDHKHTTGDLVKELMEYLVNKCLEKPFWSTVLARNIYIMTLHGIFGSSVKLSFIQSLQNKFDSYLTLDIQELYLNPTLKNYIILLGETFLRYRLNDKSLKRYQVYSTPLCILLKYLCKSNREEDMEVLAKQISCNGEALKKLGGTAYDELLLEIRLCLLETGDNRIRLWLLLSLDLACYGESLSISAKKMYCTSLGEKFFSELEELFPEVSNLFEQIPTDVPLNIVCN